MCIRDSLRGQLVDHQLIVRVVVVMQPGLVLRQNEIGFEANDVVEEAAELVDFAAHNDVRARVLLKVSFMMQDLLLEGLGLLGQLFNLVAQFEHREEVALIRQLLLLRDAALQVLDVGLEADESFLGEVLGRRLVLLDALQVLDREEGLLALLVDDRGKLVVLVLDLLDDLFLDALLLHHRVLHARALLERLVRLVEQVLELTDLERARLLERHAAAAATVQVEVAVVAEGLVMDAAIRRQFVFVLAHADLGRHVGGQYLRGYAVGRGRRRSSFHHACC